MIANIQTPSRSKVPVSIDLTFGYAISAAVSTRFLSTLDINGIAQIVSLGTLLSSILLYIQPVEKILLLVVRKKLKNQVSSPKAIDMAFDSTYLDYTKSRIESALYVMISLLLLKPFKPELFVAWPLITLIVSIFIVLTILNDIRKLVLRTLIIAAYNSAISQARNVRSSEFVMNALSNARNSLSVGNWKEAFDWLMLVGIPADCKITEETFKEMGLK
jgi:hypothetical protein